MSQNRPKKQAITADKREPQPANGQPAADIEERIVDPSLALQRHLTYGPA
jgi:hypothetical protein